MAVNKVIYGGNTLVDLTGDTVTAADLADGVKATGADGNPIVGLMKKVTIDGSLSDTSTNPVQNKVIKEALDGKLGKNETAVNALKVNNLTVETAVPKNAKFTDTVYDNATTTTAGLMSASDKVKLNGIAANANNYTHPSTHPASMITGLASVATSGSYNDLKDKPAIPTVPTNVSAFINDAGYLTQHQSLDGYAKTSVANPWTAQQNFNDLMLYREKYTTHVVTGTAYTPTTSTMLCTAVGAFTLDLRSISSKLATKEATVFTAYIKSDANYTLTITNAGTIKYLGSASDVAITSAGLLLNIMMLKDASGNLTSIVQASKLS